MRLLDHDVGKARPRFLIAAARMVETGNLTPQIAATREEVTRRREAANAALGARGMTRTTSAGEVG